MGVRIGIVGLGIGLRHARSLAQIPDASLAALADLSEERVEKAAREAGARAYGDWRQMLAGEPDLEAVILATPAAVRREPIQAIAERGIALFCEKPPAVELAAARGIASVIAQHGILNSVGFHYRWAPPADRLRALIAERPCLFARIVVAWPVFDWIRTGNAPEHLYRKAGSGGPLIEQGIHFQDILRYITGDEPIRVLAAGELGRTEPRAGRDTEETTVVIVHHQSGMLTSHVHNWSHRGILIQLQLVGDDFDLTWQMEGGVRLHGTVDGQAVDEADATDPYLEEMRGFVRAVSARDQSLIRSSYADACRSLAVCQAAAQAVRTQQPVLAEQVWAEANPA